VPWVAVFGNHDVLYQGTFGERVERLGDLLAAAGTKPRGAFGLVRSNVHARVAGTDADRWEGWGRGPGLQEVTPDPESRRAVLLDEYLQKLVDAGGHGYTQQHVDDHQPWWSQPAGEDVHVIGLDTCSHSQGSGGSLGPKQTAWLEQELQQCHRRYRNPSGTWVQSGGTDRLVVLLSHHNSWTMDNRHEDDVDPGPRTLGPDLVAMLSRFPNVVLWVNGHSHEHKILVHRGSAPGSGCWEVDTASGIDFSQQGRTFELVDNGDGTVSIFVTVLDHAAPPAVEHRTDGNWTTAELASISRELAANDDRWIDPFELLGGPEDRNVELVVAAPFPLRGTD
ncbi:MAG: TIGR03767 family metallophosphoesterase, partial [Aquihabitans sp.]